MFFKDGYSGMEEADVQEHFVEAWHADRDEVDEYVILAASGDLGGYEEWAWFLLRDKETGELFEVSGSHCSCFGFEDQFEPKRTTHKYLLSDKFWASGVDTDSFQKWFLEYADSRGELLLADAASS